ncbi:MAG TPA: ABC transporter permease [Acidimicrobiia bacterium]|nr:ABC transporter permease [Acidimicrobiia bacterium]
MVDPTFMPSPQRVLQESQRFINNGELVAAVLASSRRVIVGFFLASAFSVPLGIVLGVWQPAKAFFDPIISLLRPLPSITWIPLTMLWLGIGEVQKYAIVFMGTWIYVLLYTMESTKRVDPILIRAALNLGASKRAIMSEVVLPGSFPGIISGLKVTLAISWSTVLSAELVAANQGLGALIWRGKDFNNLALVLVGMVSISMTVLLMDVLVRAIEDKLLPWERYRRN